MNAADALIFALLALVDLGVLVHLRRMRMRRERTRRLMRCLEFAIRREAGTEAAPRKRRLVLRTT